VLFRKEGYSPLFLNASRVKLISGFQTPLQVTTSCRHDYNSLIPFSSVVVTEGHEQLIPFIDTNAAPTILEIILLPRTKTAVNRQTGN
jgi:hypothetical protein